MEFGFARTDERAALQALWRVCFSDSEEFTDLYFDRYEPSEHVFVARHDGAVAAMACWFPAVLVGADGDERQAAYLYAVATAPAYRGRGVCRSLLSLAGELLAAQGAAYAALVPGSGTLFAFYQRLGYRTCFFCREETIYPGSASARATPVSADRYRQLRQLLLRGGFVAWAQPELAYQKALSRAAGGDLFAVETDDGLGCAAAEPDETGSLRIRELLLPGDGVQDAARALLSRLGGKTAVVRMPADGPDSACRPFGMLRALKPGLPLPDRAYLGFAFE